MSETIVGIDLGTTYSVAAYVDDEGRAHVLPNAEGKELTPSVVLIEEESGAGVPPALFVNGPEACSTGRRIVVGEQAERQAILRRDRVVAWVKREMGDDRYRFQGLSAVEISAEILRKLKRDAEAALMQTVSKAVVTCPAYFAAPEVENTRKAGELAGLEVLEIVREPVAAAVFYGVDHLAEGDRLLVYDLGGGTFDSTILQLLGGEFCPQATLGDRQLGGHDWTTDLLEYVARQFAVEFGQDPRDDPQVHQELYERSESAKRDLAKLARVTIPCTFAGRTAEVTVERGTFEALTEERVRETGRYCQQVLAKAEPALTWADIGGILLVGGSTRLRRVPAVLQEVSGKAYSRIVRTAEVDTMVALGAAVIAKGSMRRRRSGYSGIGAVRPSGVPDTRPGTGIAAVKVRMTCPRHLGTRAIKWEKGEPLVVNSKIIPYGTPIPTQQTRDKYATGADCLHFDVPIVEFDDYGPDVVVGTYRFRCKPETPPRSRMAVTFEYNRSGEIQVEARDVRTGELVAKEKIDYEDPDLVAIKAAGEPIVRSGGGGEVDLLFVFDTTGSMYSYLERVREHLGKIVKGIHGDLPEARIAILAHGDHCDEGKTYLLKGCPFSTHTEELVAFINTVEPTYGGDTPEAIEDALAHARGEKWRPSAQKALVLVGDAPPHTPDECPKGLDYRKEAAGLRDAGVKIYSVWAPGAGGDPGGRAIFEWLATQSGGKFLHLDFIDDLCDLLVAVAMKEGGKLGVFRDRLAAEKRLTSSKLALLEALDEP